MTIKNNNNNRPQNQENEFGPDNRRLLQGKQTSMAVNQLEIKRRTFSR